MSTPTKHPTRLEEVVLGARYKDTILGIEGIATGVARHITGCDQICLAREKDGDAKHHWYDVTRTTLVEGSGVLELPHKPGTVKDGAASPPPDKG